MELFKIIKKTFDLVRKEVTQALSDSKSYAQKLVDAEAARADTALEGKLNAIVYNPTSDITLETEIVVDDPDFIEWNILRRVYTTGVVLKTGDQGLKFKRGDNIIYVLKNSFHLSEGAFYEVFNYAGGALAVYNVQLPNTTDLSSIFYWLTNVKYISVTPIEDPDSITSVGSLFKSCSELIYTDFALPTKATNYRSVYYNCHNLRHTVVDIDWPNATDAQSAFQANYNLGIGAYSYLDDDGYYSIVSVPVSERGINVNLPSCLNCSSMFTSCNKLEYVKSFYAPKSENVTSLFANSIALKKIESITLGVNTVINSMFKGCTNLMDITPIQGIDEEVTIQTTSLFEGCSSLINAPELNFSIGRCWYMFSGCENLQSIPKYKLKGDFNMTFMYCYSLTDIGGFEGLSDSIDLEYSPLLTRDSCLNIFNYAATTKTVQRIFLHSEAYARLTEEDIAIAVNKGWTVQSI